MRDGDHYIVNGQKTWTTLAQHADWGFFLVRTDPTASKQAGISFLLIDMKSPGVTVRPIITLDGAHEVNEVFLDNVKVPVENRDPRREQGLDLRQVPAGARAQRHRRCARSKRAGDSCASSRPTSGEAGRPLADDPFFRRKLAELEIDLTALEYTELRILAAENAGKGPGVEVSMLKIKGTEIQQRLNELALEALGPTRRCASPRTARGGRRRDADERHRRGRHYFNVRKTSIYGGSNEIQRNIIAKVVLGL